MPLLLPLLIGGGLLVVASGVGGTASRAGRTIKGANRRLLRDMGEKLEREIEWPGLADFLDATAYTESRWSPGAGTKKVGTNGAIGAYQIRPKSAFTRREWGQDFDRVGHGADLLDPIVNTAAIVDYMRRVFPYKNAPSADWARMRAALAYPHYIGGRDRARSKKRFDAAVARFSTGLEKTGTPQSFARRPAYPPGWGGSWRANKGGVAPLITLLGGQIPT